METCRFCLQKVDKLHPESHIVPEWMHKDSYENRRAVLLDARTGKPRKVHKGIRARFLCTACEDRFAKDDHYASLVLTDGSPTSPQRKRVRIERGTVQGPDGPIRYEQWEGLDFRLLQKFVLGVAIRGHLAHLGRRVMRRTAYKRVRDLYLSTGADDDSTCPIQISRFQPGTVCLPFRNFDDKCDLVTFVGGGYQFNLYVSLHQWPRSLGVTGLGADGRVSMVEVEFQKSGVIKAMMPIIAHVEHHHGERMDKLFNRPPRTPSDREGGGEEPEG